MREAERLRKAGSETELAAQWRQRYEQAMREKEDLTAKLNHIARGMNNSNSNSSSSGHHRSLTADARSSSSHSLHQHNGTSSAYEALEKRFQDLKDEYKLYRKKAMAALQSQQTNSSAGAPSPAGSTSSREGFGRSSSFHSGIGSTEEAKMAYLRNLLLKYLGTEEAVARQHMERAIGAVLQFSPRELQELKERRDKETASNNNAWLASVTSLLGKTGNSSS